ncbi:MAG: hypothetical protein FJW37_09295 [Acidobacteria bacterium]|nr:hypothetical protein [Acidobacteriota bacterium]
MAFFGFGRGGFGHGRVGWVPLAPHEPYYPWYGGRHYGRYPNRYSRDHGAVIINNINIRDRYRNARVRDSISALDDGRFVRGEFSGMLRLSGDQLGEARLVRGNLPWTPGMEARRLSDRGPLVIPRSGREGGRFYSRWQPGGAARNPPEDRRSDFRGQVVAPVGPQDAGWRRFGAQGRSFERPGEAPGGEDSGGWRRFGSPAPDSDRRQREWPRFGSSRGSDGSSVGRSYEGWRRFGDFGGNYPDERFRRQRGFEMGPGESVPGRARRPEALEIAPPVVRERSSRRMEGESGGFGQPGAVFRGGGRSWGGDRSARGDGGTGGSGGRSMERGARGDRGGRDSGYSGRGGRAGGRSR